ERSLEGRAARPTHRVPCQVSAIGVRKASGPIHSRLLRRYLPNDQMIGVPAYEPDRMTIVVLYRARGSGADRRPRHALGMRHNDACGAVVALATKSDEFLLSCRSRRC